MEYYFQCTLCPMGFSDHNAVERHMRKTHNTINQYDKIAMQNPIPLVVNSEGKVLLPPKGASTNLTNMMLNSSVALSGRNKPFQHKGKSGSATLQNLHDKLKQKQEQIVGGEL